MRFDPVSAECLVLTFKEGLLSAMGHDLKIRVTRFTVDVDEEQWRVDGRFDAASLRVVCAVRDGVDAHGELGGTDKRRIEETIIRDVLQAERYPEIRFVSTSASARAGELAIKGILALHGRARELVVEARREDGAWNAVACVHQPDFGIRPYSAMLGTIRLQPDVTVRIVARLT